MPVFAEVLERALDVEAPRVLVGQVREGADDALGAVVLLGQPVAKLDESCPRLCRPVAVRSAEGCAQVHDGVKEVDHLDAVLELAGKREILAEHLEAADIDAPEILVDGVLHRRVLRAEQTYLTTAGEVCVKRTLYRPRSDPNAPAVAALDKVVGMVDGYLTPEAAATALYVVAEMTPKGAEALFKRIGNTTPSKSTLDRVSMSVAIVSRPGTKTRRRASGAGRRG